MGRYRKKPVVIDAIQNEGKWRPIMAWLDELAGGRASIPFGAKPTITRDREDGTVLIETLEGTMRCDVGDWLICGVQGEFYPCKPDIFEATYEAAGATKCERDGHHVFENKPRHCMVCNREVPACPDCHGRGLNYRYDPATRCITCRGTGEAPADNPSLDGGNE